MFPLVGMMLTWYWVAPLEAGQEILAVVPLAEQVAEIEAGG